MTPYRVAHVPAVRRGPSLAMRIAMRLAEFWCERDASSLQWYRRAAGRVWVKNYWWLKPRYRPAWVCVDGMPDLDLSAYETERWP